jgi:hypothetical protein
MYASSNIIKVIRPKTIKWTAEVTCKGEMRRENKALVGKTEETGPLGRKDTKLDLREIGWEDVERVLLASDSNQWRDPMDRVMTPSGFLSLRFSRLPE